MSLTSLKVLSVIARLVGYRRDIAAAVSALAQARPGSAVGPVAFGGITLVGSMFRDGQSPQGGAFPFARVRPGPRA